MYNQHVQPPCTTTMYNQHVQPTSKTNMYNHHAQPPCPIKTSRTFPRTVHAAAVRGRFQRQPHLFQCSQPHFPQHDTAVEMISFFQPITQQRCRSHRHHILALVLSLSSPTVPIVPRITPTIPTIPTVYPACTACTVPVTADLFPKTLKRRTEHSTQL